MTQRLTQETENGSRYTGLVSPLPGCPDVAISHAVYRTSDLAGGGVEANKQRLKQLKDMGYSCVICTVTCENKRQRNILEKCGWNHMGDFYNRRTNTIVSFWRKCL